MDKRRLRVSVDHAQRRVSRPGIPFAAKGFDFLEGDLSDAWISPVTGRIQPIPNIEEAGFQTSNAGPFKKFLKADYTFVDDNPSPPANVWSDANPVDEMRGVHYTGDNLEGAGAVTVSSWTENQGFAVFAYSHSSGLEQKGPLIEFGWGTLTDYAIGTSCRIFHDGRAEIWKDGAMMARGSFSGGGYEPGSVRGGSYQRASNEYLMIRAEIVSGRYLLLTSSLGGVFQFACPWADPSLADPEPVTPAGKWWWYVPQGSASVIAAPVYYKLGAYAVSPLYRLSEAPGTAAGVHQRTIPGDGLSSLTLKAADGSAAYDPGSRDIRFRLDLSPGAWVDGLAGIFPPLTVEMPDTDALDVTDLVIDWDFDLPDGPEGISMEVEFLGAAPVADIKEREGRPYLVELLPFGDDTMPPVTLLDGIAGPPQWRDGLTELHERLRFSVRNRLSLLQEAIVRTVMVFDGLPLCQPVGSGVSAVYLAAKEAGYPDSRIVLPDLGYTIPETPPQRAGEWNMAADVGDSWSDVLTRLMDLASHCIWGERPGLSGLEFYVIEPDDSDPPAVTLYRSPEQAEDDGFTPPENELMSFPWHYDDHSADKLPREANLVRITGYDPAADKGIQTYISDDNSRDPLGDPSADGHLGFTREFAYTDPGITTQDAANRVAENVWRAVGRKKLLESWRSFFLTAPSGVPVWRGDVVCLKGGAKDGGDTFPRVSGFQLSPVDESGEGLSVSDGGEWSPADPMPVRLVDYVGGSIVGLGGSSPEDIRKRFWRNLLGGGERRRGWKRIPAVSMGDVVEVPIP